VDIADIIGRDIVAPDQDLIVKAIKGKSILVTGAGGSIGSELCRQILAHGASRLVLFEHSEIALYKIEAELRTKNRQDVEIVPLLGSVCNEELLGYVYEKFEVDCVYHAAAYKHVPIVENNVSSGVMNNVFGTFSAAKAAVKAGVRQFVLISTDKAVRPTNVMGATKRLAELILQGMARQGGTCFSMVRFGNVIGSSGSVVPLFKEQLAKGGPLTVTHSEVTRYFMTIPEAVQLVLQAGSMSKGGEVFVLNMGEPVSIFELAQKMIRLSGLSVKDDANPGGDVEIRIIGLRPGEKLHEELFIGSNISGTSHPMIMQACERDVPWPKLCAELAILEQVCRAYDAPRICQALKVLVEGYRPDDHLADLLYDGETDQTGLCAG
jgi:FlaA1/EpsC-like NDP-sugar epimerase